VPEVARPVDRAHATSAQLPLDHVLIREGSLEPLPGVSRVSIAWIHGARPQSEPGAKLSRRSDCGQTTLADVVKFDWMD